ncbi:hypothetical protein [Devosia sp.]|uniref:hypothetical protein n=1 Tax=Devosia sp. TaxID=1871048 RepID=UPI003265B5E8
MAGVSEVPPDVALAQQVINEGEEHLATETPTNWWSYGLIGLGIVIAVLLALQLMMGAPGSDVQNGTPTAAPVTETAPIVQ